MKKTTKKKSAREKRVLIGALAVAAVTVAGSTFAWFSSSDEVTNRLSASADYNITIAEDFTPPENWVPGQTIDKNVGVVNTGNVDAFVRAWLEGEMKVVAQTRNVDKYATNKFEKLSTTSTYDSDVTATITGLTDVTDTQLKELGLTYSYTTSGTTATTYYLKELDKTHRYNNPTITSADNQDVGNNAYSEVEAVQAGGVLTYTDNAAASFTFKPNQTINFTNAAGTQIYLEKGTVYTVTLGGSETDITQATNAITVKDVATLANYLGDNIDTDTFLPKTSGLYIFRRNVKLDDTTGDDYEFTGYYYVAKATTDNGGEGKYFALQYDNSNAQRSDYVIEKSKYTYTADATGAYTFTPYSPATGTVTDSIALYTAERKVIENSALTWDYVAATTETPSTPAMLKATYAGSDATNTADDIIINIALDNIDTGAEKWTAIGNDTITAATGNFGVGSDMYTFYYNNDVEEGATTSKLVDSVELDSSVTQNAYLAFDFDLNVFMDSVQVTIASDGKEAFASVAPWQSAQTDPETNNAGNAVVATGEHNGTQSGTEIEKITWAKTT